jgi:uncharacterized protein with PQ loop repeat
MLMALMWSANLLNAGFMAHQLFTVWQTRSAEGLSVPMMVGFLFVQVIYTIHGWQTNHTAMIVGMGLSAACNVGVIFLAMKFNKLIRLSEDQASMLDAVERAFGIRRYMEESHLVSEQITLAELSSLTLDGFLIRDQQGNSHGYRFASDPLRKEIVARRWCDLRIYMEDSDET